MVPRHPMTSEERRLRINQRREGWRGTVSVPLLYFPTSSVDPKKEVHMDFEEVGSPVVVGPPVCPPRHDFVIVLTLFTSLYSTILGFLSYDIATSKRRLTRYINHIMVSFRSCKKNLRLFH